MEKFNLSSIENHKPDAVQLDIDFDQSGEVEKKNLISPNDGLDETQGEDLYERFNKIKKANTNNLGISKLSDANFKGKKNIYKHHPNSPKNPLFNPYK